MTELIDRQSALKKMCETCGYCERFEKAMRTTHPDFVTDKCNMYKFIAEQPTIEAEPVRHGRWETWGYVFHGIEWKRCSRCGKCADVSYYGLLDGEIKMSTPSICGGCGARMDGGADNG